MVESRENRSPRVAVVTGAASGIGAAIASRLSKGGLRVALVDRNAAGLRDVAATLAADRNVTIAVDLTAEQAPAQIHEAIPSNWGPVAVLVNNAGVSPKKNGKSANLQETDDELWSFILSVNLTAAFRLCREFAPRMRDAGWGRVVNIASQAARTKGIIAGPGYMASKAGMLGLTRSIASEFAAFGVTANCICPGRIETPMFATSSPETNAEYIKSIPVMRFGKPEEIAAAVEFFASEGSGFITGAVLDVNGGTFMG